MTSSNAVIVAAPASMKRTLSRILAAVAGSLLFLAAFAAAAQAQAAASAPAHFELLVHTGRMIPTGALGDVVRDANLSAAQLAYVLHPSFAVTTTVGWARSRDIASQGDPRLDVFTYDIGAEIRAPRLAAGAGFHFTPLAGVGAGGRSYNYRRLDEEATHNAAAYASAGGEFGYRRARIRVEARNYVTGFRPLTGTGPTSTGNDVALMIGFRRAAR
jgi:opacity protein-like surface antigen